MERKSLTKNPWTRRDLGYFFMLEALALVVMIDLSIRLFQGGGWLSDWPETWMNTFLYLLQSLALLLPLYFVTRVRHRSTAADFGLAKVPPKTVLKYVGLGYLIYYVASAIFIQLQLSYGIEVPGYGEQASHVPLFGNTITGFILGGLVIIGLAPIVEELLFRGFIYQIIRKYMGFWGAGILSAGIFAGFHLEFEVFIPLFILGFILAWVFERSRSLWTPILFHVVNNTFAFLLEIAVFNEWMEWPV